jgi:hypothetical protein
MGENMARLTVESIRVFTHMNPKLFVLIPSLVVLAVCAKASDVVVQKETETTKEQAAPKKEHKKKQDVEIQETEKVKKAPKKEQENVEIQKTEVEKEKAPKKDKKDHVTPDKD